MTNRPCRPTKDFCRPQSAGHNPVNGRGCLPFLASHTQIVAPHFGFLSPSTAFRAILCIEYDSIAADMCAESVPDNKLSLQTISESSPNPMPKV